MTTKKRPKSVRRPARTEPTSFRMDFEVSISQFSGDPSDYITVYNGKIIEEKEDDSEQNIGSIILYLVERSRVINDRVSLFDVMDCLDGDSYDCFANLFEQDTEEIRPEVERIVSEERSFDYDLLLIDRLELAPEYRGRGIGRDAASRAAQKIGRNCGVIACVPVPLQFSGADERLVRTKQYRDAQQKVRTFWESVGFTRVPKNDYFIFKY